MRSDESASVTSREFPFDVSTSTSQSAPSCHVNPTDLGRLYVQQITKCLEILLAAEASRPNRPIEPTSSSRFTMTGLSRHPTEDITIHTTHSPIAGQF